MIYTHYTVYGCIPLFYNESFSYYYYHCVKLKCFSPLIRAAAFRDSNCLVQPFVCLRN